MSETVKVLKQFKHKQLKSFKILLFMKTSKVEDFLLIFTTEKLPLKSNKNNVQQKSS